MSQPFPPSPAGPPAGGLSDKSKVVAGILGILLGGFGVHQFYLGNSKKGAIQIGVTLVTCGVGSLWGFVEGILYLIGKEGFTTDAQGRTLQG
ncbi:TM2 domain-containing protein [Nocardioides pacificus]